MLQGDPDEPAETVLLPPVDWVQRQELLDGLREKNVILVMGENDNVDVVASYLIEYGFRIEPGPTPQSIFLPRGPRLGPGGQRFWNPYCVFRSEGSFGVSDFPDEWTPPDNDGS